MAAPAISRRWSISPLGCVAFIGLLTSLPLLDLLKHTKLKEPPGHELDPADHDLIHDGSAGPTQGLDPNFTLDPPEILTIAYFEPHDYPSPTRKNRHLHAYYVTCSYCLLSRSSR